MIAGLDTSVIVRLLVGLPESQARVAARRVQELHDAGATLLVTDIALAETYHALHQHYGVPKAEARAMLRRFAESGVVSVDPPEVAAVLLPSPGAGLVDRMIHARHRARGGTTLTFERAQGRLDGAERLRPGR